MSAFHHHRYIRKATGRMSANAQILSMSPGCARVSLTAGNADLREAAANEIAALIVDRHDEPSISRDVAQLALPLA